MSRSALEKRALKQIAIQRASAQLPAIAAAYGYPAGYPTAPLDPATGLPMPIAPVPPPILRGDDEDYDDSQQKKNALPIHGNSETFNINNLLFNNIMENPYFHALYQLRTYHEVIDEIQRSVKHVEPWETGTARYPSSAFCLLVKFMLMKLTMKQMNGLLTFEGAPFVRAVGLLYLRYTCPPADLWKWYEPYLEDEEDIKPCSDKSITMTIGSYCIKLLSEMQYFGTTLPRIPVPIERKFKVLLLLLEEKKKRRVVNLRAVEKGWLVNGSKVKAIYGDEENEPAWYDAVVTSRDEEQPMKFWVTFPEYGNSELVDLGDIELPPEEKNIERRTSDRSRSRSRSRGREGNRHERRRDSRDRTRERSRSRSGGRRNYDDREREKHRDRDYREKTNGNGSSSGVDNLLQKVLQSEREASAAVGRNYGQRPASYKGSLSLKLDRYTARKSSPSEDRKSRRRSRSRSRSRSRDRSQRHETNEQRGSTQPAKTELSVEHQNRLKMLREKYGDASASSAKDNY